MKNKLLGAVMGVGLMAGFSRPVFADAPESDAPIIIAINEWTGRHIMAHMIGNILERMGCNVEYVTASVLPVTTAIADGSVTVGAELWDNNLGACFPALLADGSVADAGEVGIDGREGWLYPPRTSKTIRTTGSLTVDQAMSSGS